MSLSAVNPTVPNVARKKHKPKLSKAEKKQLRLLAAMKLKERLMREQLLRELELNKKSVKRGKQEWEEACKEIKLKEFREEIETWAVKSEMMLDKKDEKINMLIRTIDETQEMHERNVAKHLDHLKYLAECHQTLRDTATAIYDMQASQFVEDFLWELSAFQEIQEQNKLSNENILHSSNVVTKDRLRANYEEYMKQKFTAVTSAIEKRYALRDAAVRKMGNLQNQLILWINDLQGNMIDVRKTEKFLYFMQRQRNYVRESNKLNELERMSQKTISELQQEHLSIETESNRKIYGLKLEQAYFFKVRSMIKNSIERDKQLTHEKLLAVSTESYAILNKLKEIVRSGELLLGLAVCCNKYKTQKEKVVPWRNEIENTSFDHEYMFKMSFDLIKHLDISEEELAEQMSILSNFWHRCSDVRVHNQMLNDEKRKLTEENEKYRDIIRSMKKSDDVKDILKALQVKQQLL